MNYITAANGITQHIGIDMCRHLSHDHTTVTAIVFHQTTAPGTLVYIYLIIHPETKKIGLKLF